MFLNPPPPPLKPGAALDEDNTNIHQSHDRD